MNDGTISSIVNYMSTDTFSKKFQYHFTVYHIYIQNYIKHYQYNRQQAVYLYQQISVMSDKDILDWISSPFHYYPLSKSHATPQGKMLYFDNGLVVNLETQDAFIEV